MKRRVLIEGWMTRSRKSGFRLPLFRSHWVRRYFVLISTNSGAELEEYHDEKKERLRKKHDLSRCEQVDSYLQVADNTCTYPRFSLISQWIFSLHMNDPRASKPREVFFISQSESEMNNWVHEVCRSCKLVRQNEEHENGYNSRMANGREETSPSALSSSFPSMENLDSTICDDISDLTIERDRAHIQSHRSTGKYEQMARNRRGNGHASIEMRSMRTRNASADHLPRASSSASACSSMASSHRSATTEDDASSLHSTHSMGTFPPLPPKPNKSRNFYSNTGSSSAIFGGRSRVIDLGQSVPTQNSALIEVENESSGETIKMHTLSIRSEISSPYGSLPPSMQNYFNNPSASGSKTPSVCSSMAYGPVGPPVDRSNKPAKPAKPSKLRLDQDDNLDDDSRSGNSSTLTRTPRTPQYSRTVPRNRFNEPPKSAGHLARSGHLDYFEPRLPLERAMSVRSATPTEPLDYIKIDSERTQAIKKAAASSK